MYNVQWDNNALRREEWFHPKEIIMVCRGEQFHFSEWNLTLCAGKILYQMCVNCCHDFRSEIEMPLGGIVGNLTIHHTMFELVLVQERSMEQIFSLFPIGTNHPN